MDSGMDAIICVEPDGTISFWNTQAEKLFGWRRQEVLGKQLVNCIIPERHRKLLAQELNEFTKKRRHSLTNTILEISALKRCQAEFPVELTITVVDQGTSHFLCAFIRDVTERKHHISAIEGQSKKLREIAWKQSHEVRAPLSRIMGLVKLINSYPENNSELFDALLISADELDQVIREIVEKANQ